MISYKTYQHQQTGESYARTQVNPRCQVKTAMDVINPAVDNESSDAAYRSRRARSSCFARRRTTGTGKRAQTAHGCSGTATKRRTGRVDRLEASERRRGCWCGRERETWAGMLESWRPSLRPQTYIPAIHTLASATTNTCNACVGRTTPSRRMSLWWLRVRARVAVHARGSCRPSKSPP